MQPRKFRLTRHARYVCVGVLVANSQAIVKPPAPAPACRASNGILSVGILALRNLRRGTDTSIYCVLAYDQQQVDTRERELSQTIRFDVLDARNPSDVSIWVYDGAR